MRCLEEVIKERVVVVEPIVRSIYQKNSEGFTG